jgi:hypothetical protein
MWIVAPLMICLSACAALQRGESEPIDSTPRFALTYQTQWQANIEFEDIIVGGSPPDWFRSSTGATRTAIWQVMQGPQVPSRTHVLGVIASDLALCDAVHLLWTDEIAFESGTVQVDLLPRSGERCQSAGLVWRVQDAENYYLCRWDALAGDLVLGVVVDGEMRTLASWPTDFPGQSWHRIRVDHRGDAIEVQFAGASRMVARDDTLMQVGGVGLWAGGDSQSAFDGLIVERAAQAD